MTLQQFQEAVAAVSPTAQVIIEVDGSALHTIHNVEYFQSWDGVDMQIVIIRIKTTEGE